MTVEEAFALREQISQIKCRATRNTLVNILYGDYDKYKNEKIEIAKDDITFLKGETK